MLKNKFAQYIPQLSAYIIAFWVFSIGRKKTSLDMRFIFGWLS